MVAMVSMVAMVTMVIEAGHKTGVPGVARGSTAAGGRHRSLRGHRPGQPAWVVYLIVAIVAGSLCT